MKWFVFALALLGGLFVWFRFGQAGELPVTGQPAPTFTLPDQEGRTRSLKEFTGRWVVLYFYPKDDTPGCTQEACTFRDDLQKLTAMGAQVLGISVDDSASHASFARKYHLPFPLLADKGGKTADAYGALMKLGVTSIAKRYTFLIDPQGRIAKIYLKVDTSRHSKEIIDDLARLQAKAP